MKFLILLLSLTQISGCMTTKMLEIANANGKIRQYEARDFDEIGERSSPDLIGICIIHHATQPPGDENAAIFIDVDFSRPLQSIKIDTTDLPGDAECLQQSGPDLKRISILSPHDAGNLQRYQLAGRGAYRKHKILLAHQASDYEAPVQRYTAYRNAGGVISGTTEIIIDSKALQQPVSRIGEMAAYAVVPLAVLGDVVTSPIQAIGVLLLIETLPKRY